ncbi:MAG: response regulator [Chromatiales bacterium]|jgi:two-component system response regulator DesR|nr:response regulator [Chromatiales bacterium]MDX9766114.1 response regulator [Ectothiorhodospiraceae bacterium]
MTKILVVDDSATSRLLLRAHMPKTGDYQVVEASDLDGALAQAREHRPALVFLDYNMPGRNGAEIARELRAAGIDAVLYLLTANTQQGVINAALEAGIQGVLEKPITADKLAQVLRDAGL